VGEVFSGAPYVLGSGGAYQAGFRQIFDQYLSSTITCSSIWRSAALSGGPSCPSGSRAVSASSAPSSS